MTRSPTSREWPFGSRSSACGRAAPPYSESVVSRRRAGEVSWNQKSKRIAWSSGGMGRAASDHIHRKRR